MQNFKERNSALTQEQTDWWSSLDMSDKWLTKMWCGMFGTVEQRIQQLFIIRHNQNFKKL